MSEEKSEEVAAVPVEAKPEEPTLKNEAEVVTETNGDNGVDTKALATALAADYILVQELNGEETIEIPTSEGVVLMTTLQASFPGATGLKYKNPKTGAFRAVQVDASGLKLIAPTDGWEEKTFTVILAPHGERVRALSLADATSAKRRKVGSGDESDSDDEREGRSGRKRVSEYKERSDRPPVDLIVLGVDFKTTDEEFKNYFENIGNIVFCEIKRKTDGSSKGFGFVRMATIEEQNKVLAIPQHMIDGRRCDVKVPDGRDRAGRPSISRIFVGRLTDKVDDESLRRKFTEEAVKYVETAVVTDVFIPKPFRGFAFVTLSSAEAAERIVGNGSLMVNGVSIGLSIAQPREESQTTGPDYGLPAGYRHRRAADRRHNNEPIYGKDDFGYGGRVPPFERQPDRDRRFWPDAPRNNGWF